MTEMQNLDITDYWHLPGNRLSLTPFMFNILTIKMPNLCIIIPHLSYYHAYSAFDRHDIDI